MKEPWSRNDTPSKSMLGSVIGRAHLDKAHAEGQAAGNDPEKTAADCPYDHRANLMTVKAWETGFHSARSDTVARTPA
jgi:ribosome modulation factor